VSAERKSHVPKTRAERQQYNKTVIQAPEATAATPSDEYDATDTLSRTSVAPSTGKTTVHHVESDGVWKFLRAHIFEELLILAVGWGAYTLFTLNREVGEVREEVKGIQSAQQQAATDLEREMGASTARVDHLEQRLDGMVERPARPR
jgi:hypothetical protein